MKKLELVDTCGDTLVVSCETRELYLYATVDGQFTEIALDREAAIKLRKRIKRYLEASRES